MFPHSVGGLGDASPEGLSLRVDGFDVDQFIRRLNRLSLLEASAPELHSWTFDVDEG